MDTVLARKNMNEKNKIWQDAIDEIMDPASGMSEEESKAFVKKIMAKLKSGKNLSAKELNYLRIHDPKMYMTAMRVKHKKESIENKLKNCKSKEEARDIIDSAIGGISKSDPDKEYLVAGIRQVEKEFKSSKYYKSLPEKTDKTERQKLLKYLLGEYEDKGVIDDFNDFEEGAVSNVTPIAELLDILPVFDAKS